MNTKRKGSIALGAAIAHFINKGSPAFIPVSDSEKYDLVIEEAGILKKVQCKYTSDQEKSGAYIVSLRTFGGYRDKTYFLRYKDGDFDYLFVYCKDGKKYLIPWEKILNKAQIVVGKQMWNEYLC